MARFEFKLPDLGEGVAEGEVVAWHVGVGDPVREDQAMLDVMTDKATVTIGAPKPGTILEARAKVGEVVPVGSLLVVIETEEREVPRASHPPKPRPPVRSPEPAATAVGDIRESVAGGALLERARELEPKTGSSPSSAAMVKSLDDTRQDAARERPLAAPATRRLARELGIDLSSVAASGPGGRITQDDVRARAHGGKNDPTPAAASPRGLSPRAPGNDRERDAAEERRPFVGVRRKIAQHLQTSKRTAAHFTFVEECDVGRLKVLRERLMSSAEKLGAKLTLLPFITKAVVAALKRHPMLNASLDEGNNELVLHRRYDIGIATATDQGLLVPVIRDADRRSLVEIARELERLSASARAGSIRADELSGSTFTITSLGALGGLLATPILNYPEVGILGVHKIKQRPVVRDGEIVIGEVMLLSLSFDHRIVDGHVGAAFAYEVIGYLEEPERLLLE